MDNVYAVLFLVYMGMSYWATNKVWWSKRVYFYSNGLQLFFQRIFICLIAGIITIPWAIISSILENR